jgi:hypothetical protein
MSALDLFGLKVGHFPLVRVVPEPVMSQLRDWRIAGLSALENLRITVTLGAASGCRLASTRCPIAERAVGRASSTPILLAAYPL